MQANSDMCLQQTESSQYTEINHHSTGEELHYPHMNCISDMADDQDCSIWRNSETLSDKGNCERSMSGSRHRRTGKVLHGGCKSFKHIKLSSIKFYK